MKKLVLLLILISSLIGLCFSETNFYAELKLPEEVIGSTYLADDQSLESLDVGLYRFEITQQEYESGTIDAQKLADAIVLGTARRDDFSNHFELYLKAFALVVLDEINILRVEAGLPQRTISQLKTAVKNKVDTIS